MNKDTTHVVLFLALKCGDSRECRADIPIDLHVSSAEFREPRCLFSLPLAAPDGAGPPRPPDFFDCLALSFRSPPRALSAAAAGEGGRWVRARSGANSLCSLALSRCGPSFLLSHFPPDPPVPCGSVSAEGWGVGACRLQQQARNKWQ